MNSNKQNMTDSLQSLLKGHKKLSNGLATEKIKKAWLEIMPEEIHQYTGELKFKDDTLRVKISSSALKQNLLFRSDELIKEINSRLGSDVVKEIKLL